MKESTTYQAILREGRVIEAQRLPLLQGEIRFGSPDEGIQGTIEAIRDIEHLETILNVIYRGEIFNRQFVVPTRFWYHAAFLSKAG
jgi:hypothetical protein